MKQLTLEELHSERKAEVRGFGSFYYGYKGSELDRFVELSMARRKKNKRKFPVKVIRITPIAAK